MNIARIDDPDLIQRLGQSSPGRSTGVLHLSDIYGSLMRRLQPKRFDRRGKDGKRVPMDLVKVESGLVFENMLEKSLAEKFATARVGEIISAEGIRMTPDGWNPTDLCLEEYRYAWMSSRVREGCRTPYTDEHGMFNEKFVHWSMQIKGVPQVARIRYVPAPRAPHQRQLRAPVRARVPHTQTRVQSRRDRRELDHARDVCALRRHVELLTEAMR